KAVKIDPSIGTATVYRMINTLEEIGAISRNTMYHIACSDDCAEKQQCRIELTDGTKLQLDTSQWHEIVRLGLKASGFQSDASVKNLQWETVQA
ncbi:MAG: Fur family transcriptional regulator, partial [Eubacterium sp.]|nr:Fur family transcriptional regulator [Eubacterium sp.]